MSSPISVIIPLYNKEKHIEGTLQSVFSQSYTNFEVLLIDDGSTDEGLKIVRKSKDHRLRIFSIANSGVSYARNYGIKKSNYDLIAFLDADDLWLTDHLKDLVQLYHQFPKAGLYCTSYIRKFAELEIQPKFNSLPEDVNWNGIVQDFFKSSSINSIAWTSAVMVPKRIFNLVGTFDTSITMGAGEDTDLWIRIAKDHQVAFTKKASAIHNLTADNRLTNTNTDSRTFLNLDRYSKDFETNPSLKTYIDLQRFSIAIQYKRIGNEKQYDLLVQKLDKSSLNWKQQLLLSLPANIISVLYRFQKWLLKHNIYRSAYH